MLKSMYSGISGMKANQTKMDVVGNNVANVGTTSFKKSSTRFSDTLYQTSIYASSPIGETQDIKLGGVNPGQIGMGTKVSGVFKNTIQGSIQATGRISDLAIDGDGYFKVQISEDKIAYTRDGSFNVDKNNNLVTADGYKVLDSYGNPINIPNKIYEEQNDEVMPEEQDGKDVIAYSISSEGELSFTLLDGSRFPKEGTTGQKLGIAVFKNPEGLEALSGNLYGVSANSGEPIEGAPYGSIKQGAIEMSNVDLSEEFTEMIVTTRAFQASSKVITTSDELLQEIINLKR